MQGSARKDVVFGAAGVYPCDRARAKMEILATFSGACVHDDSPA